MERPSTPSVEASEPEKEQAVVDAILEGLKDGEIPRVMDFPAVRAWLQSAGLDIDSDGFIITQDTGEYAEPYAFSKDAFNETDSPVDDPIASYTRPETEIDWVIGAKERLHLSDLHSIYPNSDGEGAHPVRDDTMNLRDMIRKTGMTYLTVTAWSDGADLVEAAENPPVLVQSSSDDTDTDELELNCFDCGYRGSHEAWERDEACSRGTLRCPECNCLWKNFSIDTCTACQTTHRWEDITPDDDGDEDAAGAMYWEPSCPECGADSSYLHSESRYKSFSEDDISGGLREADAADVFDGDEERFEEAKAFDYGKQ